MNRHAGRLAICCLAAAAFALATDESASGARLLTAEVEVNGQLVLQTFYTDDGTEKRETVWRYLAAEPGGAETAKIVADVQNPEHARLEGDIVIRIQHGGSPVVQARATELELIRVGSPNNRWYLPAAEVERIGAASGIPRPSASGAPAASVWIGIIGGLAVLGCALALLVWTLWPRSRKAVTERG